MSLQEPATQPAAQEEAGGYGTLGALADRIWDEQGQAADGADIFEAFIEWAEGRGIELWTHQEDALLALMSGNHVILGTPTGSGKSLVALGMHFMALCRDQVSFYTAPIKALVSEKFFQLCEYFGRDYVGMITGDSSINPTAPIICCTAEILANRALAEGPGADIAYAAMDEFHFYADVDRGWAWQVPLIELTNTSFLLMSATLGDTSAIAAQLQERSGRSVDVVANAPRPVPLSFEYTDTALEGTVELALRAGDAPIYIVHFSQDAALNSAQALASYGVAGKEERAAIKEACKGTSFNTAFGKILQRLLGCGVGVHHAGMLPRYRLLVEKLAQEGLLPVICGTDTLGVGINVPIHTVLLTALTKFDGRKQRRLNAREFHQIAGRAGRSGFDTEGMVIALAPEHEIENAKLKAKAAGDPKKLRKLKLKSAPENFVNWNQTSFQNLIDAVPEALKPRMRITHSMVLNILERGGDARARVEELISASHQDEAGKEKLRTRAEEIFTTLIEAGVVEVLQDEDGNPDYVTTVDMPRDFALDQPLSPFLLAALELLDPEDENYALDVVSMAESTLEQPRQILRAQERRARDKAMAQMKADGVEYDERLEKIQEVSYPKPLEELLEGAFSMYCEKVPWARDYEVNPKSILREMLETGDTFKSYISAYGIARSEGLLLRYLSDAFRVLDRTIPLDKRNEQFDDIVAWLGVVVRSVDSSLVDEWAGMGEGAEVAPPAPEDVVVADRRGMRVLVRNALFQRVRLASLGRADELGRLDLDWGVGERKWRAALEEFYAEHEELRIDADARSAAFLNIDESDELSSHLWHVRQIFCDAEGDHDFRITADVDLDATQDGGEVVFTNYRAGFFEEL